MRRLLHDGVRLLVCCSSQLSESRCGMEHFSQHTHMCQGTRNCFQQALYLLQPFLIQRDTCRTNSELTCWMRIVPSLATTAHSTMTFVFETTSLVRDETHELNPYNYVVQDVKCEPHGPSLTAISGPACNPI